MDWGETMGIPSPADGAHSCRTVFWLEEWCCRGKSEGGFPLLRKRVVTCLLNRWIRNVTVTFQHSWQLGITELHLLERAKTVVKNVAICRLKVGFLIPFFLLLVLQLGPRVNFHLM